MGSTMISYISELCLKEKLLELYEVLLILLRTKRTVENKIMTRIKSETDQNPELYSLINSMSYLGSPPWKRPTGGNQGEKEVGPLIF